MITRTSIALCFVGLLASAGMARTQETPFRYRNFTLGATVASIAEATGGREPILRTQHERPELLRTFDWRMAYPDAEDVMADPVRSLQFYFVGEQLYRIDVHYDRERTLGLTGADLTTAVSTLYGEARPSPTPRADAGRDTAAGMSLVSQWGFSDGTVSLLSSSDAEQFMLVVESTSLGTRAAVAARQAERLDVSEAPQRALAARQKALSDALDAKQRARARNKAAFRP
ncbi:MAG: hypothetical protein AB7O28_14215 [Vicinamibacterales bacterium]